MISFPTSKINLGLQIVSKRADGYHNINSIFYPIPIFDILEINHSEQLNFNSTGLEINGNTDNNLIIKAYFLLKERFNIGPVNIHLHKQIPMGAGLGGGSADAAFALNMFNDLFNLKLTKVELEGISLKIGSDCPFFIENKPKYVQGRGDTLSKHDLNLKGKYLKIINPGIHISTKEAYSAIQPMVLNFNLSEISIQEKAHWKETIVNDFERPISDAYSIIGKIKRDLYKEGAFYASMSGTGSTVYGLFDIKPNLSNEYEFERIIKLD